MKVNLGVTSFDIGLRKMIQAGIIVASLLPLGGAGVWAYGVIKPYAIDSDSPPIASVARVQALDVKYEQLAANFNVMLERQKTSETNDLFLAQGFWTGEVVRLQGVIKKNPYDVDAAAALLKAQAQLRAINDKLYNGK